jgi:hypothetical protein
MREQNRERGQVLPFIAICLTALMGFAGLAVDLGYIQYEQRQQQSAADAAAIAGAQALITADTCPDGSAATAAAQNDAAANGFTNDVDGVTVTATSPPTVSAFSGDNCAVLATVTSTHPTWFSKLMGFGGTVSTSAIAAVVSSEQNTGCLYILEDGMSSAGNTFDSPNCGILINGDVSMAGGTVDTDQFSYSGSLSDAGTDFTDAPATQMLPVPNPCPEITGCNYLTNNPPSTSPCNGVQSWAGSSHTLTPGCYAGISAAGAAITLDPGLYVFTGDVSNAGGSITGSGVTIYQESGAFSSAGPTDSLSACTTSCTGGAVSGVLYFQPPSNPTGSSFAGSTATYSGLIYAPTATVSAAGTGSGYTVWVVGGMSLAGNNFVDTPPTPGPNPGPTPAGLYIKQSVLAY